MDAIPSTSAAPAAEGQGYWREAFRRFRKDRLAMAGFSLVIALSVVALLADLLANGKPILFKHEGKLTFPALHLTPELRSLDFAEIQKNLPEGEWMLWAPVPYGPTEHNLSRRLEPPSRDHPLGTDDRGRDVLSRLIHGSRVSLSVGFVAEGIALLIGLFLGALAGYYGGKVDMIISRLIEIVICFPTFFLILAVIAFLPPSIYNIMVVIGLTGWTGIARLTRAEVLRVRTLDYVQAARAAGTPAPRIIFRHVLPNAITPAIVSVTFGVAAAILVESSLSFLGFGVPPPTASWGEVLSQSRSYIDFAWWLTLFPGAAIFVTMTAYNLVGEGLRDATDPRLARARG
ncbi:MAG: ABC transporter permease [Bdellovibrionota bacterium]